MEKIDISFPSEEASTQVHFGTGILHSSLLAQALSSLGSRFVLVTDETVQKAQGHLLLENLSKRGLEMASIVLPSGEEQKSRETKQHIEDIMLGMKCGRDTVVVALGGGVISDLAGFVAATYCRGIPLVTLPTTLLSMVDACMGGKTGVNAKGAKNMIGSFHPASHILIDPSVLSSLSENEMRNGLAEIIKYGLILTPSLIPILEEQKEAWNSKDASLLETLIFLSLQSKKEIIEKDPKERGLRRILNFGHTVGHAIESLLEYQCSHGEAIAAGMCIEGYISMCHGLLSPSELEKIIRLFFSYGFKLFLSPKISYTNAKEHMALDKKNLSQTVRFVMLASIGQTASFGGEYCQPVSEDRLQEAFHWFEQLERKK